MTARIVPLADIARRVPEAGRIRLGMKSGKAMKSLDTFRFTSPDRDLIAQLADQYGGQCQVWNDPKASPSHQFEVITTSNRIQVYLPQDSLTTWYELWAGGGVQRRCDGVVCQIPVTTPDGWEMDTCPCLCVAANAMQCRAYTRLNVILPTIAFRGVWRLETKGWNAASELPGMVDLIANMSAQGKLVMADLGIQKRNQMTPAGKRNFVVPTLSLPLSPENILAGGAEAKGISAGTSPVGQPALEAARPVLVQSVDEIVDAEIISDEELLLRAGVEQLAAERYIDGDRLWTALCVQTNTDLDRIAKAVSMIAEGKLDIAGFQPDGTVAWKKN